VSAVLGLRLGGQGAEERRTIRRRHLVDEPRVGSLQFAPPSGAVAPFARHVSLVPHPCTASDHIDGGVHLDEGLY
jgi:hypothetical protein